MTEQQHRHGVVWRTLRVIMVVVNLLIILNSIRVHKQQQQQQPQPPFAISSSTLQQKQTQPQPQKQCPDNNNAYFDLGTNRYKIQDEQNTTHSSSSTTTPTTSSGLKELCSKLPLGATSSSLWHQYASLIYQASLHPLDVDQVHAPWTKALLDIITPHLLERGLRTSPMSHQDDAWRRTLQIVQTKLQHPNNDTVPPLQVAIVGGSVTEGGGCDTISPKLPLGTAPERPAIRGQECAWPFRLQQLLDAVLGPNIIQLHNLAVGGTHSLLAVPVLEYWLFPQDSPLLQSGPDVIINAYAANDNLPPPHKRGDDTNMTGDFTFFYREGIHKAQTFVRTSIQSRPSCQRQDPLVLFVDEYLGNQHNLILGELFRFEAVDIVADWYRGMVGVMSSAHVLRRLIYANADEAVFSPHWKKANGVRRIDVHAGMPSHVVTAWTVAYSLLTMVLNVCEEETMIRRPAPTTTTTRNHHTSTDSTSAMFVSFETLQLVEHTIPPVLNANLTVDQVATQWKADAQAYKQSRAAYCASNNITTTSTQSNELPCSFAFVAAPMGTVKNANRLNDYVKEFIVQNNGWAGQQDIRNGWQNKLGLVATQPNASVTLHIHDANQISKLILHSLKSYGPKWEGSKARFTLKWENNHTLTGTTSSYQTFFDIEGFHNQNTSIAYPFVLDLGPDHIADPGSTVELKIDLIGGTTFKINALMLCSR